MGRAPRVVIIVENLPVPFDRRVWQEAGALRDAGWRVTVISPTGRGCEARRETRDGIDLRRFALPAEGTGPGAYLREYTVAFAQVARLVAAARRDARIDVLQACNPPEIFFPLGWLVQRTGARFVFDHHDLSPELYEAKFGRRDALFHLLVWLERRSLRTADLVITTNASLAAIARGRGGIAPEKIVVVRNGPDLRRLYPVLPVPALKRGRRYLCAYVGMMGEQDGIDLLLATAVHVTRARGRADLQFVLAGDGPVRQAMAARARELGVAAQVTFAGRLEDAALRELLSTADACIVPDAVTPMNDKSTMVKTMEYMAFAKPVVQFEMTEARITAGEAALYARPGDPADLGDKLLTVLDDPGLAQRLGEIGRGRVERELAWEHQAKKLVAAYERLRAKAATS